MPKEGRKCEMKLLVTKRYKTKSWKWMGGANMIEIMIWKNIIWKVQLLSIAKPNYRCAVKG